MFSEDVPTFSTSIMRAIVVSKFGGPDNLELKRNVPIPKANARQVIVKVAAVGVNPIESYIRAGNHTKLPQLPYIPGSDVSGTVVFVGAEVKGFQKGDHVCSFRTISGGYAEYSVVSPEHLIKIPVDFDLAKAAAVGTPYATAYRALFIKGQFKPGESVLIHAANSGVGVAACQMALSRGMEVYATAGTKEAVATIKSLGVKNAFNHRTEGYTHEILKESEGVNGVIEMMSNVNLAKDLTMLKKRGRIMVVGCRGPIDINPRLIMANEVTVIGIALGISTQEELIESVTAVSTGLKQGWLDPLVGKKYPLKNSSRAHEELAHNLGNSGKLVLIL